MTIAELRRLEAAATPTKWSVGLATYHIVDETGCVVAECWNERPSANLTLICAARNSLPALLRVAEAAAKIKHWERESQKWPAGSVQCIDAVYLMVDAGKELDAALAALERL